MSSQRKYDENLEILSSMDVEFIMSKYNECMANSHNGTINCDENWLRLFNHMGLKTNGESQQQLPPKFKPTDDFAASNTLQLQQQPKQQLLQSLINKYKKYGHLYANTNPIAATKAAHQTAWLKQREKEESEIPQSYKTKIDEIKHLYTGSVGVEIDHIEDEEEREWLESQYENTAKNTIPAKNKTEILSTLLESEVFDNFLKVKFVGAKRFSIAGGDSLICMLKAIVNSASNNSIREVICGMAHRGRLAVLGGICKKDYHKILAGFMPKKDCISFVGNLSGDVKYHNGYAKTVEVNGKNVNIALLPNPSHLEAINPVLMGVVKAKQTDLTGQNKDATTQNIATQNTATQNTATQNQAIAVAIHGDAAMSGQGVVAETVNMSQINGYNVCGSIHIAINNQVGFTANPKEERTARYCTDVAKTIGAPVFHINGDDPEACYKIAELAVEYRQKFKKDIFLDLVCYRKYGHNEGDEPKYTHPKEYELINKKSPVSKLYTNKLISDGVITQQKANQMEGEIASKMDKEFETAKDFEYGIEPTDVNFGRQRNKDVEAFSIWKNFPKGEFEMISEKMFNCLSDANLNPKISKLIADRKLSLKEGKDIDWGTGEMLTYASILKEGKTIRFSGQDCQRGTFSHRHAIVTDLKGVRHNTLADFCKAATTDVGSKANKGGRFEIHNSSLSEFGAMGFEYGYDIVNNEGITIWEAQFGDFANGASTIIDQFLSSAYDKWLQQSGLILLLPHGYDGQGAEHSSARLERYLQLCAKNNMIVANCTTPANYFHIIRRQLYANKRKPLIIMSPKSLLRHKMSVSQSSHFINGSFSPVIEDENYKEGSGWRDPKNPKNVKKVIIVSGKIFYDAKSKRDLLKTMSHAKAKANECAIIRVEQYYPFPTEELTKELSKYKKASSVIFLQEEPQNMGCWNFIQEYVSQCVENSAIKGKSVISGNAKLQKKSQTPQMNVEIKGHNLCCVKLAMGGLVCYVGRHASASPATGFADVHAIEQDEIITSAIIL